MTGCSGAAELAPRGRSRTGGAEALSSGREHGGTALRYAILAILSDEPTHGYAIVAKLDRRIGDLCAVGHGQVYRLLAALEQSGHIVGRDEQVGRRPTRRVYAISDAGDAAVE